MRDGVLTGLWVLTILAALVFAVWLGWSLANAGYTCVVVARVLLCHKV